MSDTQKHTVKYLGTNDANDPLWSVQWPKGGNRFCFLTEAEAQAKCDELNARAEKGA